MSVTATSNAGFSEQAVNDSARNNSNRLTPRWSRRGPASARRPSRLAEHNSLGVTVAANLHVRGC